MNHPHEGTIQALIDGELPAAERERVERHTDDCDACADLVAARHASAARLSAALGHLDRPAPVEAAYAAVNRRVRSRSRPGSLSRAAVIVFGFAAAASAAVPGSPIRDWAGALVQRMTPATASEAAAPAPASADGAAAAGVAITPRADRVHVSVGASGPGLRVRVRIVDGGRVAVSAERSIGARFETGLGRIGVFGTGTGTITIELPRTLGRAEIEVGGRPYVVKDGERLRFLVPPTDTTGAEILFDVRGG